MGLGMVVNCDCCVFWGSIAYLELGLLAQLL